jgi:hypothetical protein
MFESLLAAASALRTALASADLACLSGDQCASLVAELSQMEKACSAVRALATARASECGEARGRGFTDAAEWLARTSGSTRADARRAMDTASNVQHLPATLDALRAGELSMAQADEIARTVEHCPDAEGELLEIARQSSLQMLRDHGRKRRAAAIDPSELYAAQCRARQFRHWRDELGMVRFSGALTPEIGVPFTNRLDAETDRVRRAARRGDTDATEPREAYAADAFAAIVAGGGRGRARTSDLVLVCDLRAYRRGHTHDGELCHIVGGGPIPVDVLKQAASDDAFVKAVIQDGVRIDTVIHLGRHMRAELRTALELGPLPNLDGVTCVEMGCDRRYGLEWDHVDPVANGGPTSFVNVKPRCWPHHREKTERDRLAGLLGNSRGP